MTEFDVVVVGGGAAGLSSAMMLGRARRTVAVVDAGEPRNAPASHLHGFLSRDGMDPAELLRTGRQEVASYGGEILSQNVQDITKVAEEHFEVQLSDGQSISARAIVMATGVHDELPEIRGLRERWGQDVHFCPYCHGYEVSGQALGVIGGEDRMYSVRQAQLIRQWSEDVVFFPNKIVLTPEERRIFDARGVQIAEGEVTEIVSDANGVRSVERDGNPSISRDALFVGPLFVPSGGLLASLGCDVDEQGWVITDRTGKTSVDGVWAAGNIVDPTAQLINAAAAGSAAAIAMNNQYLVPSDTRKALEN